MRYRCQAAQPCKDSCTSGHAWQCTNGLYSERLGVGFKHCSMELKHLKLSCMNLLLIGTLIPSQASLKMTK